MTDIHNLRDITEAQQYDSHQGRTDRLTEWIQIHKVQMVILIAFKSCKVFLFVLLLYDSLELLVEKEIICNQCSRIGGTISVECYCN